MDSGQLTVDSVQWTVDSGQWTVQVCHPFPVIIEHPLTTELCTQQVNFKVYFTALGYMTLQCSALQCITVHYSALQYHAVQCSAVQCSGSRPNGHFRSISGGLRLRPRDTSKYCSRCHTLADTKMSDSNTVRLSDCQTVLRSDLQTVRRTD